MHRTFAVIALAIILTLSLTVRAAEPEVKLPDTDEASAVKALIERFAAVEKVETDKDGKLKRISLRGLPDLESASFRMEFDAESQRVVEVGGNRAAFRNDEWVMFVPFKELRVINLHHNFGAERENREKLYDAGGLVVLKDSTKIETINLPGSPFGADGLKAIAQLTQVKNLGIWHVNVSDDDFVVLRGHPSFESIRIAPMWSDKITGKTFEHLSHCPNLKAIKYNEGYVTWETGLKHLTKLKAFEHLDLEKSVVDPADLAKFREAVPSVKVEHAGLAVVGKMIKDDFKGAAKKLPKWVPQGLIDTYVKAAESSE